MKRKLLIAALLLVAALLLSGLALAATNDPIVCSMEVSPNSLSEPGDVTVTITVSNSGNTDMKDPLTLYSPTSEVVTDFGENGSVTLKAGEVKTWTGKWNVNQHTLDNGQIVYFVKYTLYSDSGEKEVKSQPIRGKLEATQAVTDIQVKRTITPSTARKDQAVSVQYDIVNTGTVSLKNITIKENKDISSKTVTVPNELKAGETAQVKFPVTMGKKNLTSSATITYTSGDSTEKKTVNVDAQEILYGEAALTATLTASAKGVAINGTVTLTLQLKNSGTVNYSDVRVTDATLGDVFTNQQVAAGKTLKLDKEITLTETTNYQFTITAIDDTGTTVTLKTDSLTLTAVDPNKSVHLNVVAAADRTEVYEQPGTVRFTITVENDGDVDAANVEVYEAKTLLYTIPSIPVGQSRKITRDALLSIAGKYQFSAVTVDVLNISSTFQSNEIQIAFSVPTAQPATMVPAQPTPEPTYAVVTYVPISNPAVGTTPKLIRAFFYPLLWVSGILLICVLVLLALATRKRLKERKESEAALDHLDRAKRRDYVTPIEETEKPETVAEESSAEAQETTLENRETTDGAQITEEELPHLKYIRNAQQQAQAKQSDAAEPQAGVQEAYRRPKANTAETEAIADVQEVYHEQDGFTNEPAADTTSTAEIKKPQTADAAVEPEDKQTSAKHRHRRTSEEETKK